MSGILNSLSTSSSGVPSNLFVGSTNLGTYLVPYTLGVAGGATDPWGGTTAATITEAASTGLQFCYQSHAYTAGSYIISWKFKLKAGSATRWIQFYMTDGIANGAGGVVNASTGAFVGNTILGSGITAENGTTFGPDSQSFYSFYQKLTFSSNGPSGNFNACLQDTNTTTMAASIDGDGTSGVVVAFPQISRVTYQVSPYPYIAT